MFERQTNDEGTLDKEGSKRDDIDEEKFSWGAHFVMDGASADGRSDQLNDS